MNNQHKWFERLGRAIAVQRLPLLDARANAWSIATRDWGSPTVKMSWYHDYATFEEAIAEYWDAPACAI